jgi:hypothetical protein
MLQAIPEPTTLLQAIIQAASNPAIDVAKVAELTRLHQQLEAREWERLFNVAMSACQADLAPVARNRANDQTSSRYADLAALAEHALPIIHSHGFAVSFGETATEKAGCIGIGVRVSHREGHTERLEFHIPVETCGFKGTPNKTLVHAYGSAITYCRRYALLSAFNIIVAGDDDGNAAGKRQSAYAARKAGDYPGLERRIRGAQTMEELQRVWSAAQSVLQRWPQGWVEHITEEKELRKQALMPLTRQLADSAAQLDRDEGIREAISQDQREPSFCELYSPSPWR